MDCFCGSGTTLKSAQTLNRQWIGIDQSELAIQATLKKMDEIKGDLFVHKTEYEFIELDNFVYTIETPHERATALAKNNVKKQPVFS